MLDIRSASVLKPALVGPIANLLLPWKHPVPCPVLCEPPGELFCLRLISISLHSRIISVSLQTLIIKPSSTSSIFPKYHLSSCPFKLILLSPFPKLQGYHNILLWFQLSLFSGAQWNARPLPSSMDWALYSTLFLSFLSN